MVEVLVLVLVLVLRADNLLADSGGQPALRATSRTTSQTSFCKHPRLSHQPRTSAAWHCGPRARSSKRRYADDGRGLLRMSATACAG
jgi:hypothetical protein